jgi:hemerythrin superfamily protein
MEVFAFLKADHRAAAKLMDQLEAMGGRATRARQQLLTRLEQELEAHAEAEERLFYPALEGFAETRQLVGEAREDHEQLKHMLADLDLFAGDAKRWKSRFATFRRVVERHIEQEEIELFAAAGKVLDDELREELGSELAEAKREVLRLAHRPSLELELGEEE